MPYSVYEIPGTVICSKCFYQMQTNYSADDRNMYTAVCTNPECTEYNEIKEVYCERKTATKAPGQ